jgi:hypothetical protein
MVTDAGGEMSKERLPYDHSPARLTWDLEVRGAEVWLVYAGMGEERLLGREDAVMTKMADWLAEMDFGER